MSFKFIISALLIATLAGCAGYPGLRDGNREKLAKLQLGMNKEQVEAVMGNDGFGQIMQPYKREVFEASGLAYEVLYYYTDYIQEFQPMDTGMTPVIFRQGRFIGAGKDFLVKVR